MMIYSHLFSIKQESTFGIFVFIFIKYNLFKSYVISFHRLKIFSSHLVYVNKLYNWFNLSQNDVEYDEYFTTMAQQQYHILDFKY